MGLLELHVVDGDFGTSYKTAGSNQGQGQDLIPICCAQFRWYIYIRNYPPPWQFDGGAVGALLRGRCVLRGRAAGCAKDCTGYSMRTCAQPRFPRHPLYLRAVAQNPAGSSLRPCAWGMGGRGLEGQPAIDSGASPPPSGL
jgi:hypothetical protein